MPSFDIVSEIDHQSLDNAINNARKEILNRYDFRDSKSEIEFNKKDLMLVVTTENDMRMGHIEDVLRSKLIKQQIDANCMDFGKERYASGDKLRKDIRIKEGIDKEMAKKIIKDIKETKMKVSAQIMEDQIRVTGKKIDDLQEVIALCKAGKYGLPLQYVNMK